MDEHNKKPHIVIVQGPTASGKSDAAVAIACAYQGEIVNADSLQLYREFDIGTAKPTSEERAVVPHHLFDVLSPGETSDAGRYIEMAGKVIEDITSRGKLPVICGGTNLYIRALLGGLVDLPKRNDELRAEYQAILDDEGVEALFARLEALSPDAREHIEYQNPVRIIRALEVQEQSGTPIWVLQAEHRFAEKPYHSLSVGLDVMIYELRSRIRARAEKMLAAGLMEETRRLRDKFSGTKTPALGSIGYKECSAVLDGELEEDLLQKKIEISTWRYAKRQLTWLKREKDLKLFAWPAEEQAMLEAVGNFLKDQT